MTARQILPADADGTPEWLTQRTKGIGGTDIADALTGAKSPRRIVASKAPDFQPEPVTPELQAIFDFGHEREPILRRKAAAHFGVKFRRTGTWQDNYRLANPDALTAGGLLEIKTTGPYTDAAKDWREGIVPRRAWIQAHWYAAVTGRHTLYFIGEVDRRVYPLGPYDADPELLALVLERGEQLWAMVQGEEPDEEPGEVEVRPAFVPTEGQLVVEPWDDTIALVDKLRTVKAEAKRIADEQKTLEAAIKNRMGDATELRDVDGRQLVTWAWSETERFDRRAAEEAGLDLAPFVTSKPQRRFLVKESAA